MIADPYWINQQLAIVLKPAEDSLDAEMQALHQGGIDVLISLLEDRETTELGLQNERTSAERAKIIFVSFPIRDHDTPRKLDAYLEFLNGIERHLAGGKRVGIHCRACVGRSSVVAASLLIRSGVSPEEAWRQITVARGYPVPETEKQRSWVNRKIKFEPSAANGFKPSVANGSKPSVDNSLKPSVANGDFPHHWSAEILKSVPLIAPARQFTYPRQVPGEEDTLARGALQVLVRPVDGGSFLATCALGFTDPSMPTSVFSCPNPDELGAAAGGYVYLIDTLHPERATHIPLKPVTAIYLVPTEGLILFIGFHTIVAWGANGEAWHSGKLSWEGITIRGIDGSTLHGTGWDLLTDREQHFALDLRTGRHEGGGWKSETMDLRP